MRKGWLFGALAMAASLLMVVRPASAAPGAACTGRWTLVPTPSPGTNLQALLSVDSVSASEAWAVGFAGYTDSHGMFAEAPLIEQWDGTTWTATKSGLGQGILDDVEVLASEDIWAVGRSGSPDPLDYRPLIVHYDGFEWTPVPSPQIPQGQLTTIAAMSPADIWAAGMEIGTFDTIVEHWDGTAWTAVDHPSPKSSYVNLGAIAAAASDDVWLVGGYLDRNAVSRTLAEHWDGSSWAAVPTPNVGARGTALGGVTAVASNDVWASGTVTVSDSRSRALIEHWDGRSWEAIPPERAGKTSSFGGIGSRSNADIWAVGSWSNSPGAGVRTLTEHSSGTACTRVDSPNVNEFDNMLLSVSASPDGFVWAVGFYQGLGVNRTLAMRLCP